MPICCRWLCVCWLQVDDQRIAGTELEKSEELKRLAAGVGRRQTQRLQSTRGDQMGLCASKADELHENKVQCSPAKSVTFDGSSRDIGVGFKTLSFDSPQGSSAEVGTLLCASGGSQTDCEPDFSESHHEMLQRRLSGSLGEISFTSYLSSPLIRELDFHGFDAIAKSYVESAGKAAARDTFMFLKENDRALGTSSSIEQLCSDGPLIHRFPVLDSSSLMDYADRLEADSALRRRDISAADAALLQLQDEFRFHASRPGSVVDANEVVKTRRLDAADKYYPQPDQTDLVIDFGVSLQPELVMSPPPPPSSVEEHKSLFDTCFPATNRWASVVNAARQPACLPARPLIRLPNLSTIADKRKEAAAAGELQLVQCPGTIFESVRSTAITQTAAASTPRSIQKCVMGCCGSGEKEGLHVVQCDAKHYCASSARTTSASSGCDSQQKQGNSIEFGSSDCHAVLSTTDHDVISPSSTTTGDDLPEGQGCLACFSLANGLRMINLPSTVKAESKSSSCRSIMVCSSSSSSSKSRAVQSEHHVANCQAAAGSDQQLDHDPDTDAFFSFPSSPSAAHHVDDQHEVMIADSAASRKKNWIEPPVECCFKDCIEPKRFKSQPSTQLQGARQPQLSLKNHAVPAAFSRGAAFGSPFPVHCATTTTTTQRSRSSSSSVKAQQLLHQADHHFVDENLKLFSLEQACTLTLAWNSVAMDSLRRAGSNAMISTEPESLDSPETSSSNLEDLGFRDHVHDTDDSSSDLFEIGNIQGTTSSTIMGFNRLDFPQCLPINTSFTTPRQLSEISSGQCCNSMSATTNNPGSISDSSSMRGAKAVHVANTRTNSLKEQAHEKEKRAEKSAELVKEAISSCYAAANNGQHSQGIVLMKLGLLKPRHLAGRSGAEEKQRYPNSQGTKISLPIIDSESKTTPFGTTINESQCLQLLLDNSINTRAG